MTTADPSNQSAGLQLTDSLIDKFLMSLPPMDSTIAQHRPEIVRSIAITHCLAHVSMVQLHYGYLETDLKSAAKCMGAAKAVLAAISAVPAGDLVHTDPVLPVSSLAPSHATSVFVSVGVALMLFRFSAGPPNVCSPDHDRPARPPSSELFVPLQAACHDVCQPVLPRADHQPGHSANEPDQSLLEIGRCVFMS